MRTYQPTRSPFGSAADRSPPLYYSTYPRRPPPRLAYPAGVVRQYPTAPHCEDCFEGGGVRRKFGSFVSYTTAAVADT